MRGSGVFLSGGWSVGDSIGRYCRIAERLRGRGGKSDVGKPV